MHSRTRFALAPAALGLVALLAHAPAGAQGYNPNMPPGYVEQGQGDAGVPGSPGAVQTADPSSRIATVTDAAGGLSFAPAGSDEWAATGLNRPVTTGDRLWVDPGGRAELHAGATAIRLGGATAASVLNLDDHTTQVKLTQGTLQLRVRALPPDQQVEVDTPNLAFVPREPGDYRLDVSPDGTTTLVSIRHGTAVLYGDTRSIEMSRGQRMRFAGPDLADAGPGNFPGPDSFDQWTAARDAREDDSPSARYVPRDMTGYTALDDYGDWQQDPGYGAVWFPRAEPAGWAPYSAGYWAWVAPWGWTWIDDAPWGFAPSHYGRWAYFGNRWGWVPGPIAVRPCYAPAVVGFIGGVSATISIGGGPGVAWYPLGPRDPYRPIYHASPTYITRINNVTINNNFIARGDRDRWNNREVPGAISGMPSRSFVEGRQVPRARTRDEWRHLPAGEGNFGAPPMAPVKTSLIGAAQPRGLPPMARAGFERQAIAARPPAQVGPDELARRFAREGGTAGAGPAWRGPVQDTRPQAASRRGAQPAQVMPEQPNVRVSQAAQSGRGFAQRPDQMRGLPQEGQRQEQAIQRQQFDQQRQMEERQRQSADFQQRQQQALQRQAQDQQRQQLDQQRQAQERQQMDQQRQTQQRQQLDQQRQAQERQQVDQQRQAQERQQMDQQRQGQQRQQQFDQQRQAQERQQQMEQQRQAQERQQMDQQRQAQQRQQMDQQRQAQERQQQMEQQRQVQQRQQQQLEQARQFQEQQRQQIEQQRQQAVQRQQVEQQRQVQEQQRQVQEQQRQMQEQQRQQQDRQRQIQQQQQQQQQHVQQERARQNHDQQARNDAR